MATKPCQHCNTMIDAWVTTCPHCTHKAPKNDVFDWFYIVVGLFFIYILFAAFG